MLWRLAIETNIRTAVIDRVLVLAGLMAALVAIQLFLAVPEFLNHEDVFVLNVPINPAKETTRLNPCTLGYYIQDVQCFFSFLRRHRVPLRHQLLEFLSHVTKIATLS
jgi:hypothetical protein